MLQLIYNFPCPINTFLVQTAHQPYLACLGQLSHFGVIVSAATGRIGLKRIVLAYFETLNDSAYTLIIMTLTAVYYCKCLNLTPPFESIATKMRHTAA